jgi:xanthine/CO dehydrogenase XdhC/CoxF family maturation factor
MLMDRNEYLAGVTALYEAEVLGEGLASQWLALATDPDQKYKLSLFLQLESEAKTRLRPLLARYGISLVENQAQRAAGIAAAAEFAAQPWKEAMATLAKLAVPYVDRFKALLEAAPPEDVPLVRFMVDHEQSVVRIAEREAMGQSVMDAELVVMLAHPIARPHC